MDVFLIDSWYLELLFLTPKLSSPRFHISLKGTTQVAQARNLGEVLNFLSHSEYLYLISQLPDSVDLSPLWLLTLSTSLCPPCYCPGPGTSHYSQQPCNWPFYLLTCFSVIHSLHNHQSDFPKMQTVLTLHSNLSVSNTLYPPLKASISSRELSPFSLGIPRSIL